MFTLLLEPFDSLLNLQSLCFNILVKLLVKAFLKILEQWTLLERLGTLLVLIRIIHLLLLLVVILLLIVTILLDRACIVSP